MILFGLWVCAVFAAPVCRAGGQDTPKTAPQIRVEYFGAERGAAIGTQAVTLLCIVRNTGAVALPEKTLRLRCYTLSGLDYTTGETWPALPAIGAGQALAYRWVLAPSARTGTLIAAALLTENRPTESRTGSPPPNVKQALETFANFAPQVAIRVIPRRETALELDPPNATANVAPQSVAGTDSAWLGNERVGLRVVAGQRNREPILLLGGRNGGDWKPLAVSAALFSALSGEPGQTPWRQTFHWMDALASSTRSAATLTLRGALGTQWRGEVIFKTESGTAAIAGTLRLTARRRMRLYDLQTPQLLDCDAAKSFPGAANGTPVFLPDAPAVLPEAAQVEAVHSGAFTFGIAQAKTFSYANWTAEKFPAQTLTDFPILGAAWRNPRGTLLLPGETLEVPFRLFAFAPSETLRDALRFLMK